MKVKELISEEKLNKRILELAEEINKDYEGKDIILVTILKGSTYFMCDLSRRLKGNIIVEFMRVSSYINNEASGKIDVKLDLKENIEGKDVLVIEDIVDTGNTLFYLKEYLSKKNPRSLKCVTLLDKPSRRVFDVDADYVAFTIEDKFVIGYGLDYDELYRNLPYVGYKAD